MDYMYLRNNAFKYAHLSKAGTFVQNNNEVVPLEFPEAGTYYLYKENNNVNLLSLAANSSSSVISVADGGSQTLFDQSSINLIYTINVVATQDIVDNYNQSKTASIVLTTTVDGTASTDTRTFASPTTLMQFFGKLEGKSTNKIVISAENCTIKSGDAHFVHDKLIPR